MSKATSNAHDWHCEEHDTYGWRGEECRKCPVAPSEITTLREQVEKLTKELDNVKQVEFPRRVQKVTDALKRKHEKELAALAEQNAKLREVLVDCEQALDECRDYPITYDSVIEALSLPDLASPVLNRIRAEAMEMAAKWFNDHVDNRTDTWQAQELRRMAAELRNTNG